MKSCCKEAFDNDAPEPEKPRRSAMAWLKRLGIAGFIFFLLKGILWLVVIWGGVEIFGCE